MNTYQCHKRVQAGRIASLNAVPFPPNTVGHPDYDVWLDGETDPRRLPASMFTRHAPAVGDYLVEYDGGYLSISPGKAFEEGYALLSAPPASAPAGERELPRRVYMDLWTPAETAIFEAVQIVERMGGSTALTMAVTKLSEARSLVADHVDEAKATA